MVLIIIALIVAFIIIVGYSKVLHKHAPDHYWSWRNTIVSSVLSVCFAILMGVGIYNYQSSASSNARREQIRTLLSTELNETLRALATKDKKEYSKLILRSGTFTFLVAYIQPLALTEAFQSGLFSNKNASEILRLIRKIQSYNREVDFYLSSINAQSKIFDTEYALETTIGEIERLRKEIISDTKKLMLELDIAMAYVDQPTSLRASSKSAVSQKTRK